MSDAKFTGPFASDYYGDWGYIVDDRGAKVCRYESTAARDILLAAMNAQFYASEFATHLKGEP